MAFIRCEMSGGGVKLPESVTFTFSETLYWDSTSNTGSTFVNSSVTIPTFGYHYADITANGSSVGTGANRDIRNVNSITVDLGVNGTSETPKYNPSGFYYRSVSKNYTVRLHN